MLNNGNKTSCGFADEIVSYIYDEIGAVERAKFETHLAGCHECTNEFANISHARFSVFEWQKEDFSHMQTPEIVIPYEPKRKVVTESSAGFLAGLRGWLQPFPLAAAAGLIIFLGLGLVMLKNIGSNEQPIASNVNVQPVEAQKTAPVQNKEPLVTTEVAVTSAIKTTRKDIRPVKAVVNRQPVSERKMIARSPIQRNPAPGIQTAPVLSSYEDSNDNSLRLADLLDDVDS